MSIDEPRFIIVQSYVNQGMPYTALLKVRGMHDNPPAASAGYELVINHYLREGNMYTAGIVADEHQTFLKSLSRK